jgi:ADP-ribose pyrophosphatase
MPGCRQRSGNNASKRSTRPTTRASTPSLMHAVMPAGLVGDIHAGESIEVSAVRELEEETGWTADHAEVLMIGPTSSGASSEKIAFVRATGLRRVGEGGGDDSEDITVHEIPRARAAAWLVEKMGEGYELDAKLWAGLWMIEHHLDGRPRG